MSTLSFASSRQWRVLESWRRSSPWRAFTSARWSQRWSRWWTAANSWKGLRPKRHVRFRPMRKSSRPANSSSHRSVTQSHNIYKIHKSTIKWWNINISRCSQWPQDVYSATVHVLSKCTESRGVHSHSHSPVPSCGRYTGNGESISSEYWHCIKNTVVSKAWLQDWSNANIMKGNGSQRWRALIKHYSKAYLDLFLA